MNYDFTARIEEQLDQIAEGKKKWEDTVNEVFMRIKPKLDELEINPTRKG